MGGTPRRSASRKGTIVTHNGESGRTLAMGDRLAARPCVVTIDFLNAHGAAGWCETCNDRHLIDRALYEYGLGPWQATPSGGSATDR